MYGLHADDYTIKQKNIILIINFRNACILNMNFNFEIENFFCFNGSDGLMAAAMIECEQQNNFLSIFFFAVRFFN